MLNRPSRRAIGALLVLVALAVTPRPGFPADEEGCYGCHGFEGFATRVGDRVRGLAISPPRFEASVHGVLGCRECHSDIVSIPHPDAIRDVGCGQACHTRGTGGKDYSHEALYWEYMASVHGSSRTQKIGCLVCHPVPQPRDESGRNKQEEVRRCASCHRGNAKVQIWFGGHHYQALVRGNDRSPSCPDCHTSHRVNKAGVAESSTSQKRLGETCGRGALAPAERGCHGALSPAALEGATMNPLPLGENRRRPFSLFFSLLYTGLVLGLLVRAGVGIAKGR